METITATNYCRVCGKNSPSSICDGCGCNPYAGNAYCNNCGETSFPQAMMCPKCKNYFPPQGATPYVDNYEDLGVNSRSNTGKWLVGVIVFAVAVGGILYFNRNNSKDGSDVRDVKLETLPYQYPANNTNTSSSSENPYVENLVNEVKDMIDKDRNYIYRYTNQQDEGELRELREHHDRLEQIRIKLIEVKTAALNANYNLEEINIMVSENNIKLAAVNMGLPALERIVQRKEEGDIFN